MLVTGTDLHDTPILSLQTGAELARTTRAIINPHNLAVIAYEVSGHKLVQNPSFLRIDDVRELSPIGMIIDSSEEFVQLDDIIKLKEIYELHFDIIGKQVLDENRDKLGKAIEYNMESDGFIIQQINVKRPLLKSFNDSELLIHRSQVIEVTDHAIVIKSRAKAPTVLPKASQSYTNPFRQSPPAEAIRVETK